MTSSKGSWWGLSCLALPCIVVFFFLVFFTFLVNIWAASLKEAQHHQGNIIAQFRPNKQTNWGSGYKSLGLCCLGLGQDNTVKDKSCHPPLQGGNRGNKIIVALPCASPQKVTPSPSYPNQGGCTSHKKYIRGAWVLINLAKTQMFTLNNCLS